MEVDTIPFRPTEEEEREEPFFLFGQEAIDDDEEQQIEIPYRSETPITPAQEKLDDNALMRYIGDIDPIEFDEQDRNELSSRTKQALQWIEKGLGERGTKLSGVIKNALHNVPHEDFETMETMLESAYNITEFFQELPESTADVAFRIGDDLVNAYSAVVFHASGLGFMYEEQSNLDDLIPDSENPITKIYKEMGEWYGNYVLAGKVFGASDKLINLKDLAILSPIATYLSTDASEEDMFSMYNAHPVLGKYATEWRELGADGGGVISPAVVRKFKQTMVEELLGLGLLAGGGLAFKTGAVATGAAKKNVEKLVDFTVERFKIMDAKAMLDDIKYKAHQMQDADNQLAYALDEEGALFAGHEKRVQLISTGNFELADDFPQLEVGKGIDDPIEQQAAKDILDNPENGQLREAVGKLNNPEATNKDQLRQEMADAINSLDLMVAPGLKTDPKSFNVQPVPQKFVEDTINYETYLQMRRNIIEQGVKKSEFHLKPKGKSDPAKPEPDHENVTFSDKPLQRYESKRTDNYMTVTNKGLIVKAREFRDVKDFKKAVSEGTFSPIIDSQYSTIFEKSVENERRGRVSLDVVRHFADTIGLNKDEVFKLLRDRPQGQALTNEEVFVSERIIVGHIKDLDQQIKSLMKRDPETGMQSARIADAEILEVMDQIDDLYENIIPSFLAGVSESARAMRTFALVKGPQMRRNARHMSMRLQALGGSESARTRLAVFSQLVDNGDLAVAHKVARNGYGNLLDRLFNVGIQLRANNLVSSTYSLSKNFLSGVAMTAKYVTDQAVEPLITLFSKNNYELPPGAAFGRASLYDYVGLIKGFTHAMSEATSMFGTHAKHLFNIKEGPKSFFDPQFTRLGPESTMFNRMSPDRVAEKNVSNSFQENANTGMAENMVRFIELMAEVASIKYAGFKAQMMNDEVFKTFVSTLHYHLLAGREAGRRVGFNKKIKNPQALDWAAEYKNILDNPDSDAAVEMMRESMNRGREVTFTLPIIAETAPTLHKLYTALIRSEGSPALRKLQTLIIPFATPSFNMARAAVSSNLFTGRIWRVANSKGLWPESKLILDQNTTDHMLAQEISGSFWIGSLIYWAGGNKLVTGSPEDDPAQEKLRREAGLLQPHESLGIAQKEDGVVKWYDISQVDMIGRQIILAKNLSNAFQRMTYDEVSQSMTYLAKAIGRYVTPELFFDMFSAGKAITEAISAELPGNNPKGEGNQKLKKWLAGAMAQTSVPFYSFWKEQRKANNLDVLQMGGGAKVENIEEYQYHQKYSDDDLPEISQIEKGVGIMEMFANQLNEVLGKPEEVPSKPNMFGDAILMPYHSAALEITFEMPDIVSALLEGLEISASRINMGKFVPAIEGDITNIWKTGQYRVGYDEQWLGEGGLGSAVMDVDRRVDLDTLAENIVKTTERLHPKLINKNNRTKKIMQARVYLELEALRAADTRLTGEASTISSLTISDRLPIRGFEYANERDTITLHPRDYAELVKTMNRPGLTFNTFSDELIEAIGRNDFNVYAEKGTYLNALHDMITSDYYGSLGFERNLSPKTLFERLRKVQRDYLKMGREAFVRDKADIFNEMQETLDLERVYENTEVNRNMR